MARKSSRPSLRAIGVKRVGSGASARYQDRDTGRFLKSSTVKGRITRAERAAPPPARVPPPVPRPAPPAPLPSAPVQELSARDRRAVLRQPIEIKGTFARYRDAKGRYVQTARAERLTAAQRKDRGIRRELFSRTKAGGLGKRAKSLLDALREFEEDGLTWREVPDHYRARAVALSIV